MGLENGLDSQYFIENYVDTTITINSLKNNDGIISEDDNQNLISSGLIGTSSVYKCTNFTGIDSGKYLLVYNEDDELLGLIKGTYNKEERDIANIRNNFIVKGQQIIYYKINAEIEQQEFSGTTVTFNNLDDNMLFKVYLNGNEVTDYSRASGQLVFNSTDTNQFGNSAYIIFYPSTQSIGSVDITLHYYSPFNHEVITNSDLLLGYEMIGTASVSAGNNVITTSIPLDEDYEIFTGEVTLGTSGFYRTITTSGLSITPQRGDKIKIENSSNSEIVTVVESTSTLITVFDIENSYTTGTTLTFLFPPLQEFDEIRIGEEVRKILYIDGTTIKVDKDFEEGYSGESLYRTPYKMFLFTDNEQENPSESFYTFQTKGVKMPLKVKESVENKFSFDYYINNDYVSPECGIYNYISTDLRDIFPSINKMRLIRAFYKDNEIGKFVYLANVRKIGSFPYSKGRDSDKYSASLEYEEDLTLLRNDDYDSDGILGAGGLGNFTLVRS